MLPGHRRRAAPPLVVATAAGGEDHGGSPDAPCPARASAGAHDARPRRRRARTPRFRSGRCTRSTAMAGRNRPSTPLSPEPPIPRARLPATTAPRSMPPGGHQRTRNGKRNRPPDPIRAAAEDRHPGERPCECPAPSRWTAPCDPRWRRPAPASADDQRPSTRHEHLSGPGEAEEHRRAVRPAAGHDEPRARSPTSSAPRGPLPPVPASSPAKCAVCPTATPLTRRPTPACSEERGAAALPGWGAGPGRGLARPAI